MGDPTAEEMRTFLRPLAKAMDADDFDIEEAIYWFAANWHGGQSSNLYSALSTSDFKPSRLATGPEPTAEELMGDLEGRYGMKRIGTLAKEDAPRRRQNPPRRRGVARYPERADRFPDRRTTWAHRGYLIHHDTLRDIYWIEKDGFVISRSSPSRAHAEGTIDMLLGDA